MAAGVLPEHDKGVEIYLSLLPTNLIASSYKKDIYMFNLKKIASINFVNCQGHKQQHVVRMSK